jgi:hypothetical protein
MDPSYRLEAGSFLGGYRVVRPLSVDADGEVYQAKSSTRQTSVRLRVFPASVTAGEASRAALAARCELAAGLQHAGLARCTALQSDRNLCFTAIELPDGPRGEPMTLAAALLESGGKLPEERVALLAEHLCKALQFAHRFRGDGLAHGRLSLDSIYLTAQRQPRLVDFRLTEAAQPRDDVRAMGRVLGSLLTGSLPDPAKSPCAPGLSRRWDTVVRGCLASGSPAGYADIAVLEKALEGGDGGHLGGLLWAAVVGVLVIAIAGGGWALWRYRSGKIEAPVAGDAKVKPGSALAAASKAPPAAAAQPVDALRAAVETCMAANDLAGAEKALSAWATAAPEDAEVRQRLTSVQTQRGAQAVGAIKQAAEAALAQVGQIRETEDLAARIAALKALRQEAAGHLASLRFDEAAAAYRRLKTDAESMLALDQGRVGASTARGAAEGAREVAQTTGAEKDAAEAWKAAENAWTQGGELWTALRFTEAETSFKQATEGFEKAARLAAGGRNLAAARAKFEDEKARAGEKLMARLPAESRQQLDAIAAEAEAATAAGQPAAAATLWVKAEALLATTLDQVAAKGAPVKTPLEQFPRPAKGNPVLNGELEKGTDGQPVSWSKMDNLTAFWDAKGNPGHCVRFDTNVQQADKKQKQADPEAFKGKTQGGQYNTVGAHEGVWAFPAPVAVLPTDQYFLIEADCMGPEKSSALMYPQVFIRGFKLFDPKKDEGTFSWFQTPHEGGPDFSEQFGKAQRRAQPGDYLMVWRHALVCRNSDANIWEHYRMGLKLPDDPRFRPEVILLKVYAMWPLGEYRFDNLTLRLATREEYEKAKGEGHSIEGFMPLE